MRHKLLLVAFAVLVLPGCRVAEEAPAYDVGRMALPRGQPQAGREVFLEMKCTSCHRVAWEIDLPEPTARFAGPVIDDDLSRATAVYLATSIAAPSYHVGRPYHERGPGGLSPMADYSASITMRELVDLVAYLRSRGRGMADPPQDPPDRAMLPHHL